MHISVKVLIRRCNFLIFLKAGELGSSYPGSCSGRGLYSPELMLHEQKAMSRRKKNQEGVICLSS